MARREGGVNYKITAEEYSRIIEKVLADKGETLQKCRGENHTGFSKVFK